MRAAGMQVLTDQIKAARPGTTVWGKGDPAHALRTSGHNEDDTPGVKAEDQDADDTPEHRALDVPIDDAFTSADADLLVKDLVTHGANQARMLYVNWGNTQWARSNGWVPRDNSDDPHPTHVHISGEADADANTSPWLLPLLEGTDDMNDRETRIISNSYQVLYEEAYEHDPIKWVTNVDTGEWIEIPNLPLRRLIRVEQKLDKLIAMVESLASSGGGGAGVDAEKIVHDILRPMAEAAQAAANVLDDAAGE